VTDRAVVRGKWLQQAREDAGLTQEVAAGMVGIHPVTLSKIERGRVRKLDAEVLRKMLSAYGRLHAEMDAAIKSELSGSAVSRETEPLDTNGAEVDHEMPVDRATPRVTAGRPHRIRVWLQTELGEYVKAGIPEDEFRRARQFLESEDTAGFFAGRDPNDRRSEEQILNDMRALAYAVRRSWRVRGFKIPQEPVE
jgi:transcriptional regulator with XRE-family HTH domain